MLIVVYLHFVEVRGRDDQIRKRKFFPTGYQSRVLKCQQVAVTVLTIRMDGPQEYEVESVTRARVHDKKGKKITWKYYVKWKGYGWDDSTWEPTDSFQDGSEHILESFWERIDTGGRDISDATAFKKGEELLISGPPGKKSLKRKTSLAKIQASPSKDVPSVTISAPPLATRKRRRVESTVDDEWGYSKRKVSTANPKNGRTSPRLPKRRRASLPGPRKSAPKRLPSAGDSQLDADGETDPDVVEVEDELMQVSAEDAEEDNAKPATASGSANGSEKITFDDLEHFYSGNPIDIDQNTDEQVAVRKLETRPRLQSPPPATLLPPDDAVPDSQAPASPALSSSDPLFDSPSHLFDEAPEIQRDLILPPHRARAANPLVKLIDTAMPETTSKQSRITAKARLISMHTADVSSASGPSRGIANRGGKPGPGRSSSGLITKHRSSLLTATKGALKSVKGKLAGATSERDQPDEIEEAPAAGKSEGDKLLVTSWSDEDVKQDHQAMSNAQPDPPPSGDELLKLAGLQIDVETLPDYEEDPAAQSQDVGAQGSKTTSTPAEEELSLPNQSLVEVTEMSKASDHVADASPSVSKAEQKAPTPVASDPSVPPVVAPPADEAVKKKYSIPHLNG
ncbi:hypothetical protein OG21DRAFT_484841 [Imleria badia]|nr:hypothetical protein OG21DRAFT_484841 [Imleria badia]